MNAMFLFAFVTICSVCRKFLNMFEKLWRIKVSSIIRYNALINRMFAYSFRQLALEFAVVNKFAYRDQLICISSERGRLIDESLR